MEEIIMNKVYIERISSEIPCVLSLDNACVVNLSLLKKHYYLVIGRTLSKEYSLACPRVGYWFVPTWLNDLYLVKAIQFTLNRISQEVTAAVVADFPPRSNYIVHVRKWQKTFVRDILTFYRGDQRGSEGFCKRRCSCPIMHEFPRSW
jgi:hypothetical protein